MKVLYVNTHFAPDFHYGGVVESSSKIHKYLSRLMNIYVIAVSSNPDKVNLYLKNSGICFKSIILHRFGLSIQLILPLWKLIKSHDLIVINGIFTFPVTIAQIYALLLRKRYIVSIRGGLEPWRLNHKKWRKFIFNKLIAFPLLRGADAIHVTSDAEFTNVQQLGFEKLRLISNGIDTEIFKDFKQTQNKFFDKDKFIFLFLSRTDKEKGIDILLDAYQKFVKANYISSGNNFALAIVGPDNQGYLSKLNIDFHESNIIRMDGVYGADKLQIISESSCIVLPSYSENFGNIIAEGMAMGKPVITTTGTPWQILKTNKLGYYIHPSESELYEAMINVFNLPNDERLLMGLSAKEYITSNLSWLSKASEFYKFFNEILNHAS